MLNIEKVKSMTKAAEELFIAQPAVSNTISEIEKNYNVKLFERINKRLILTNEGKVLFLKAQEVLSAFDEFEEMALMASKKPLLKIGSSLTIGKQKIPRLLRNLKETFTDVDFQVSINQTSIIENKILSGALDFAFIQGKPSDPNIKSRLVDCNNLIAVCGKKYDMPETVTLKELCRYDLLLREDESVSRDFLDNIFALENGVAPVGAVDEGVALQTDILTSPKAHTVGSAILFLTLGVHTVVSVDKRAFLADNGNIVGIKGADQAVAPAAGGNGGATRFRSLAHFFHRHGLQGILGIAEIILGIAASSEDGAAFQIKLYAGAKADAARQIHSRGDQHSAAACQKAIVDGLLNFFRLRHVGIMRAVVCYIKNFHDEKLLCILWEIISYTKSNVKQKNQICF